MAHPNRSQRRLGGAMIALAWLLLLGLLTLFFNDELAEQRNPNRDPQARSGEGLREVKLLRNRGGHYVASGQINGQPVEFLLDTGASDVAVPADLAGRLGLERGPSRVYRTANGTVRAWTTVLDEVALGPIRLHQVRASIGPGLDDDTVLLGMSFLRDLEMVQRGDTLILRQYGAP